MHLSPLSAGGNAVFSRRSRRTLAQATTKRREGIDNHYPTAQFPNGPPAALPSADSYGSSTAGAMDTDTSEDDRSGFLKPPRPSHVVYI